ncbi:hypothetical protein [Streptomyces sp. S.PB5]|uniref:hypothetical protein n=1 Tax=Streptomyces sp. S.PB5 TaxID=3020844 RepID=UPI0025AF1E96|nr:hypothetical protein [Streptomyces sp. S.PB5]MDN3025883.1 hypothetical protein [Streptomyces sp. S.PB5]
MGGSVEQYVQWAVAMLETLDRTDPGAAAEDHELRAGRTEFRSAVAHLLGEARGPLSVGVVGEFGAGKSLLIETLLGLPGLLAVSDVATTGNVTCLHVTQSATDGGSSLLEERAVRYCTAAEITELMSHLHGRLQELARLEDLAGPRLGELRAARPGPDGWDALVEWCDRYGGTVKGTRFRSVADEVGLLHTAYERGAPLLGRRYELSDAQAKRAMVLPEVRLSAESDGGAGAGDGGQSGIPDDMLAACVPLIRKVELRVRVPRRVWDLQGVGALTLMDFPGLNSPQSGERDRFLSRRELRDIHTVLVLMNAQRGPVSSEQDFFDMLREPTADGRERRPDEVLRESLLVAGGRFDQMPLEPEALRALLRSSPEPLTERRLRGLPDTAVLDQIVEAAQRLLPPGQRKQLVLVSAMAGLAALNRAGALPDDTVSRGRSRPTLEDDLLTQTGELWGKVADRLDEDDPGTPLGRALREFSRDGGLDLLRGQLVRHAVHHGGAIREDAVRRRARAVDRMRLALVAAEKEVHPEAEYPPAVREIQQTLDETRRLLNDLRDSLVLGLVPDSARADDALRRRVTDEAAKLVAAWPEWKEIFASVDRDKQVITVGRAAWTDEDQAFSDSVLAAAADLGVELDTVDQAVEPPHGVTGHPDDLLPRFHTSHTVLLRLVHDQVRAGYEARLERHRDTMEELGDRWRQLIAQERQRGPLPAPRMQRFLELFAATRAEDWRDRVRRRDAPEPDPAAVDTAFPLRRDRCLPWHPEQPGAKDALERHIVHAVRIRRELVAALLQLAYTQLGKEQAALAAAAESIIAARERTVMAHDTLDLLLTGIGPESGESRTAPLDLAARLEATPPPGPVRNRPRTPTGN